MQHKYIYAGWLALLFSAASVAVEPDTFQIRDTRDLVTLCSVASDSNYAREAISFCHGFGEGAWHYHLASRASLKNDFVCMPDPMPSRSDVIVDFINWAAENQQYLDQPAVDSLFRFLEGRFPCQ